MASLSFSLFALFFLFMPLPVKFFTVLTGGIFLMGLKPHQVEVLLPAPDDALEVLQANPDGEANPDAEANSDVAANSAGVPKNKALLAQPVEIIVNSEGSYEVSGKKRTGPELAEMLKPMAAANPKPPIKIKADASTPHQMVRSAMKLCREAGITQLSFSSKPAAP